MDFLTLKGHNFFQNWYDRKVTTLRPLAFKLQQEILKIQWYLHGLSCPETGLETNFFNLKSRNFENISFSQLTFK